MPRFPRTIVELTLMLLQDGIILSNLSYLCDKNVSDVAEAQVKEVHGAA